MKEGWRDIVLGAALAMLSGCTLLSPAEVEVRREVLNKIPLELPAEKALSASLLVLAPEAQPVYDTTQIAYSTKPYEIAYFSRIEWAERPSRMIHGLLVQTLRNTHSFSPVLTPPYAGRYTHALRSEILELTQDFGSNPAVLRLAMRFSLSGASGKVIASREISVLEPLREKTPYAGVVAANEATAKLLQELAKFVIENTG